jgi:hypothetical protein
MNCKREQLFGSWFRQEVDEQGIQHSEYASFNDDGSFEFTFISAQQDKIIAQVIEYGDWGLVADIHFTITQTEVDGEELFASDLTDENNYHAYRVLQLTNQFFEYQHLVSGDIYLLKRTMTTAAVC